MFYCIFREATTHKPSQNVGHIVNGSIRKIASKDGQNWTYTANSEKGIGKSSVYLAKVWADRLH